MELIGSRFDDGVENTARIAVIFRIDCAGDEIKFLNCIGAGNDRGKIAFEIDTVGAVYQKRVLLRLAAVAGIGVASANGSDPYGP